MTFIYFMFTIDQDKRRYTLKRIKIAFIFKTIKELAETQVHDYHSLNHAVIFIMTMAETAHTSYS